jgi:hypothetical protein
MNTTALVLKRPGRLAPSQLELDPAGVQVAATHAAHADRTAVGAAVRLKMILDWRTRS